MHGLTNNQWDELQQLVKAAARRVAAQWPGTVEREDLEQDMLVHLIERPGALERLFEESEPRVRQSFLIKVGHQLASEQQTAYDRFSGNYLYDSGQVRGYLERQVWLIDEIQSVEKMDFYEALGLLADKNSVYYAAIVNRFVHEIIPDDAGRMRVSRAVDSITGLMNKLGSERRKNRTAGPGSRRVMSNSQAGTETTIVWQGDYSDGRR